MPTYAHVCHECGLEWDEEYSLKTFDWLKAQGRSAPECPECKGGLTNRTIPAAPAVFFVGPGWSPQGYSKDTAYEQHKKEGKKVEIFEKKEDIERVMKGEAKERMIKRLKREDYLAKKYLGPDTALTEAKAEKRIKAAVDKVRV